MDKTEVTSLGAALDELTKRQGDVESNIKLFAQNFKELTGYAPQQQINALDVVKIIFAIYGEPK